MRLPGSLWRLLHLSCSEASRLSSESLDRDLGTLDRLTLKSHLLCCGACRRYRSQIARLRDAMRGLPARAESEADDGLLGPPLPDDVRDRIERALKSG